MAGSKIYVVRFFQPQTDRQGKTGTAFHFSSLSAIYEQFSREQVGCKVERLWAVKISDGNTYRNKKCEITCVEVGNKPRSRK